MKNMLRYFFVLIVALAILTSIAAAQSVVTGDLAGNVTDPSGAVIPNAQVALKNLQTGEAQTATTNAQGAYRFPFLKPGSYSATVNAQGFQPTTQDANVNLGQVTNLNIKAGLAGTSVSIEVTADAQLLQNDNANISTTYNTAQIDNLPAPGGDTTSYAFTAPGVTVSTGGGYGNFSAYGLPSNSNLFTVNGNDNNDPYLNLNNSGASNLTLGANELSEIAVVENGYSVQYGRNAGAQVNSVTKSGANQYHGNASYWYNSKAFNANDWFSNHTTPVTPRGHAVNHQYAASFGGPIIKDKLFFFADQEQLRYVLPGSTAVFLPSAQFESYVLSTLPAAQVPFYTKAFNLYNGAPGAGRAIPVAGGTSCGDLLNDPTTGAPGGGVVTPFAGGAIPCATNFQSTTNNLNTEWLLSTRVDYNISSKDTLFGRFRTDHGLQATGTDPISSVFNENSVQPEYEGQLTETHIISPSATNQFIAAGTWYQALFSANNLPAALNAFPTTFLFNDGVFTNLGGGGNQGLGDSNVPQGRNVTQWQLIDDFSKTIGNHDLKIGANFRRNDVSSYATGPQTSGLLTFNSLTEFTTGALVGNGSTYSQNFRRVNQVPLAFYSLALYGQDQWKPSSNLSLTYGLRIDRNANPTCRKNCFTRMNAPFLSEASGVTAATPYNATIQTGLSHAFQSVEAVTIQPRIGIAYTARPNTVIRAGIGIFSDLFPATIADRFITNGPNVANFSTLAGTVDAPGTPGTIFDSVAAANAAFQTGFPAGGTLASIQAANPLFAGLNYNSAAKKIANPKFVEYNFEIEQAIGRRLTASLNYVGNYGYDEFNQNLVENAKCRLNKAGTNCPFAGFTTTALDPRFNQIRDLNNHGYSNYNGINPSLRWRIADHLQGSFSYTYSKALDTCSNNCLLPFNFLTAPSIRNQIDPRGLGVLNYGPSDYDSRHALSANYVFTAPKRVLNSRLLSGAVGGWNLAQTIYYHTGYPFSVVNTGLRGNLRNVTGIASTVMLSDFLGGGSQQCSAPSPSTAGFSTCLNAASFAPTSAQADFGNIARNSFRGPGYFDTDLNLTKNFHLTERFVLGVGANAFNILNHPNFDLPVNNRLLGTFGQIQSTVGAPTSPYGTQIGSVNPAVTGRLIQLNAHIIF